MKDRPRRLRINAPMRTLVAQTRLTPHNLILPVFIKDGVSDKQAISSMPGVFQHSFETASQLIEEAIEQSIGAVMFFGVPVAEDKDAYGSAGLDSDGILNRALRYFSDKYKDQIVVMSDVCLDEFTDHGQCGVIDQDGYVDNDPTVKLYAQMAVEQARAGSDVVAPSGMMDGQIHVIREALDAAGFEQTAILAYSAKYASSFYGPFREAVNSTLQGDRLSYQMDSANSKEAIREVELDIAQGADMVMIKPAMSYLDIVHQVSETVNVPVAAYQVSGEYSMIAAAAQNGWIDRDKVLYESVVSIRRAGAELILTYGAIDVASILNRK